MALTDTEIKSLEEKANAIRESIIWMPLEPLHAKWEAFNWHIQEINGHNFREIIEVVETAKAIFGKPR